MADRQQPSAAELNRCDYCIHYQPVPFDTFYLCEFDMDEALKQGKSLHTFEGCTRYCFSESKFQFHRRIAEAMQKCRENGNS